MNCQGRNWVPKLSETDLYKAMHKDGWSMVIAWGWRWLIEGNQKVKVEFRQVNFSMLEDNGHVSEGWDADDYLAAVKAMQAAGYA